MIHAFKKAVSIKKIKNPTVVDFGCGASSAYDAINTLIGTGKYIGIDSSQEQVSFNQEKFKEARYVFGDENSPEARLAISSADIIYLRFVDMHQKHPKEFVKTIYSLMKSGAIIIIQEPEDTEKRKIEMVKKYPFSADLCDLKSKIGKRLGLDYSFAKHLKSVFKELNPKILIHKSEYIYIPMTKAKKLLKDTIKEISKKDKNKKILSDIEIASYTHYLSKLPEENNDYWNLDLFHTLIAKKE